MHNNMSWCLWVKWWFVVACVEINKNFFEYVRVFVEQVNKAVCLLLGKYQPVCHQVEKAFSYKKSPCGDSFEV
jgi:hypothetical protein